MTQIQAVKVQRLYLQVAGQLQELIGQGVFETGQRLPSERDLATQFGVSRPTIREAMIALEIAGQVEVRSGSGVYVLNAAARPGPLGSDPGPFEILEARRLIEGETCALAAQRISAGQLQQLQGLLDDMEHENQREDATEQADERFHRLIAEAAGNSALSATIGWLWTAICSGLLISFWSENSYASTERGSPVCLLSQAARDCPGVVCLHGKVAHCQPSRSHRPALVCRQPALRQCQ
jgi:GntR family transcriptional repressor for pyruvate dehydrogenase complex